MPPSLESATADGEGNHGETRVILINFLIRKNGTSPSNPKTTPCISKRLDGKRHFPETAGETEGTSAVGKERRRGLDMQITPYSHLVRRIKIEIIIPSFIPFSSLVMQKNKKIGNGYSNFPLFLLFYSFS